MGSLYTKISVCFLMLLLCLCCFDAAEVYAQCAMCRASVETNISAGVTTKGSTLNTGILYLFAAPYLMVSIIGFLSYKYIKKRRANLQVS